MLFEKRVCRAGRCYSGESNFTQLVLHCWSSLQCLGLIWATAHILSDALDCFALQSTTISFFQFHPVAARRWRLTAALRCRGLYCVTMHGISLNYSVVYQNTWLRCKSSASCYLRAHVLQCCSWAAPSCNNCFHICQRVFYAFILQANWDLLALFA